MRSIVISGINHRFRWLSRSQGQITHVLLTRSPLEYHRSGLSARLACVKHAASVRPEPGSNSPSKTKPHTHNPKAAHARKREPHPLTKNETDTLSESSSKKPRHPHQSKDANEAKQTNSSTNQTHC